MKRIILFFASSLACVALAATVESVSIAQMWPVSTDVKVSYVLSGVSAPVDVSVAVFDGDAEVSLDGVGKSFLHGDVYGVSADGDHVLYLDPTQLKGVMPAFAPSFKVKLTLSASPANISEAIYKIVDMNDGSIQNLTRADIKNGRYGSWTDDMEATFGLTNSVDDLLVWTGVTNDLRWAKDKMVFRKIPAGGKTFRLGSQEGETDAHVNREKTYNATLSKDYWMGVFEVTQYQFKKIVNSNPSKFNTDDDAEVHPADNIYWTLIRGSTAGVNWSADAASIDAIHAAVDANSFLGRFRAKNPSALAKLDLPSDVQWEVAARANVLATFYDGYLNTNGAEGAAGRHISLLGRYSGNGGIDGSVTNGTVRVGSYAPNQYGLYDVLGNVAEGTGDVFMETPANQTVFPSGTSWLDPVGGYNKSQYDGADGYNGAASNSGRSAYRGGCWAHTARACSLSTRPKTARSAQSITHGFRLCIKED